MIVQQAERAREKQHWDGIKKAQMEKVITIYYNLMHSALKIYLFCFLKVNDHEGFYAELDASANGFATVASYFCKKPIIA